MDIDKDSNKLVIEMVRGLDERLELSKLSSTQILQFAENASSTNSSYLEDMRLDTDKIIATFYAFDSYGSGLGRYLKGASGKEAAIVGCDLEDLVARCDLSLNVYFLHCLLMEGIPEDFFDCTLEYELCDLSFKTEGLVRAWYFYAGQCVQEMGWQYGEEDTGIFNPLGDPDDYVLDYDIAIKQLTAIT